MAEVPPLRLQLCGGGHLVMGELWADVPTQYIPLPCCQFCSALRPMITRSVANGDGSTTRFCVCRRCSRRFKVVTEPPKGDVPNFGKDAAGDR
jgi:hypothetical protein